MGVVQKKIEKIIEVNGITKVFDGVTVIDDLNLGIRKGQFVTLLGPSGCGKTTLLRIIAGFEQPTKGKVFIGGEDVTGVPPYKRPVNTVFQRYALFPHLNVFKNVAYGLKIKKLDKATIKEKVTAALKLVNLEGYEHRNVTSLSGGQQQRVAIARALMTDPKILLCDEATSALDPETTQSILALLKELNQTLNLTIVIISHQMSVIEAICNKVAIIDKATISTMGTLKDVFLSPQNAVAKKLIYSGRINTGIKGEKLVKLMFDGEIEKPVITNIIQECNILLSVFYAETKIIDGKTYGQIMFRLPYYDEDIEKLRTYLEQKGVSYEEVDTNDFC